VDDSEIGCGVILGMILAAPFIIAACPILAGIAVGLFFHFVVIPVVAWIIARTLGLK
jgi:hypothetical protein